MLGLGKSILLLLFLAAAGCANRDFPLPDHPGGKIYNGVKRVDVRCYRCHGDSGKGTAKAPALIHPGRPIDRELFVKTVREGRERMPAFSSVLKEEEILQIIDWLEKVAAPGPASVPPPS